MVEAYSPPRVTLEAKKLGLKPGEAWDLTTGWDFNRQDHREEAEKYLDEDKPTVLIGSPPCTPFSQLQSLNPRTEKSERKLKEGIEHMKFVVKLYKKQVDEGRVFLHEQPAHAKSWMIPEVKRMMMESGVTVVEADQCMYGLRTRGKHTNTEVPAKKPTKFMTNSSAPGQDMRWQT